MIETILLESGIDCDMDRVHVDWSPAKLIEHMEGTIPEKEEFSSSAA